MRFQAPPTSTTTAARVTFWAPDGPRSSEECLAEYMRDQALTNEAIEWQATWNREMRRLVEGTVDRQEKLLRRFFALPIIPDPVLGQRPPTARDILSPDSGRLIVLLAWRALDELNEGVAIDFLNAVRRLSRFISENSAILPSGANLRQLWGPLVPPLGDRDIPKRKSNRLVYLPRIDQMNAVFDAAIGWAEGQRKQLPAWRTAVTFVHSCETGMRGVEDRRLTLADQIFDRALGIEDISQPWLNVRSAKGGPDRRVLVDPYGWELDRWWLREQRPLIVGDDLDGAFFPSTTGGLLSSSSLSETSKQLIDHLKAKGLLHASFTFHAARKLYATHYLQKGGDIAFLLKQCGWLTADMLRVYLSPSQESVSAQSRRWAQTQGQRRRAS